MPLDDKTEIIAHFIGAFETISEAARMRIDYDKFRAEAKKVDEPNDLLNVKIHVKSPYGASGFDEKLNAPDFSAPSIAGSAIPFPGANVATSFISQPITPETVPNFSLAGAVSSVAGGGGGFQFQFTIEPPSSVATVNLQFNWLHDDDVFQNVDLGVNFYNTEVYHNVLVDLAFTAESLQIISFQDPPASEEAIAQNAISMIEVLASAEAPLIEGATVQLFHGLEAYGIVEDGVQVSEMALYSDALPAAHTKTIESTPNGSGEDDAEIHELNTGTSTMVNQAEITSVWLDAPVIAVMGDYISFNAISQVNVYNDFDTTTLATQSTFGATTHTSNIASIASVANAMPESGYTGGPEHVVVTRIDGNVINFNYVQQYNFAYDNDTVSVTFTAAETYLELSDNSLVNMTSLYELGYQYDLIVIGGNMIDLRAIQQTNVLLDADSFYAQSGYSGTFDGSDNLLWNQAAIFQSGVDTLNEMPEHYALTADNLDSGSDSLEGGVLEEAALDGTEVLRVLYISGDYLDVQLVEQTNVLGDADQIALAIETVQSANGANIEVTAGSNALMNFASIADHGVDSTVYVAGEEYTDAMLYQAEFISTEDPLVVHDTSGLASEAVLFLADEMIDANPIDNDASMTPVISGEPAADVMQSMLA